MLNPNFVHPLSEVFKAKVDGEETELINLWAAASLIWQEVLKKNPKSLAMANELIGADKVAVLLLRCLKGDEIAQREALKALEYSLKKKAERAFSVGQ
jgi:hypothetical protein